jgi:hypothetical protein
MNGEIDGQNTPEESRELERYLDAHPDARQHFEELCDLGRLFSDVRPLSPPPGLTARIHAATTARESKRRNRGPFAVVREALRPLPQLRPAYAFVAGLLIGLGLLCVATLTVLRGGPDGAYRPYGTMIADRGELLNSQCVPLELPELYGGACFEHTTNAVDVHLGLSAETQVQIVFEYDDQVSFEGYTALDDGEHSLAVVPNKMELTHSGDCDYSLHFRDGRRTGSSIRMKVITEDDVLFNQAILPEGG